MEPRASCQKEYTKRDLMLCRRNRAIVSNPTCTFCSVLNQYDAILRELFSEECSDFRIGSFSQIFIKSSLMLVYLLKCIRKILYIL
ncbi:unnamed protein product [Moneuplotes crassus]|uniref:Uncharacterized protein n=1 Tax=Euplotes crassus TaxID=5936 RepID=A0AAD2DBX4_EUPCR|nr:unnamed protein product [Moneuplotes crassus]